MAPYELIETPAGPVRVVWTKYPKGQRATKAASLAYWRAKADRGEIPTMAKKSDQTTAGGFRKVPNELNIWKPERKGESVTVLVTNVQQEAKFGYQVKGMTADGIIFTLPSQKVLQSMLQDVPGGAVPLKTVLRVTYLGEKKGDKWPTPMKLYDVEYRDREADDLWTLPQAAASF